MRFQTVMTRVAAVVLLVFACTRCSEGASIVPTTGPGTGVLFVGNSLTYTNDVPGLVAGLANAVGHPLPVASVAFPDFSLEDHWNRGEAVRAISRGGWSFVVLQQGPSSLDDSRVLLRRDAARFDARIRAIGARTALFSVWPESTRESAFPAVAESYSLAAHDVGGIYLPVTRAWLNAWDRDRSLPLYGADGFHPSGHGSYLAALVMAGKFTGASPQTMPARVVRPDGTVLSIPEPAATMLRAAAEAAITAPE
ncbi:MAG: hypothetical protein ACJ79O_10005 [Myxococcales bacterium]